MKRNAEGFGILIALRDAPTTNLLPALLAIAAAESCSLLGYPMPEIPGRPRTVPSYLFPAVNDKGHPMFAAWAFFIGEGHTVGEVDPTKLPVNQMTVNEVLECSRR